MKTRNSNKRYLPETVFDKFGALAVEMRKMPRPQPDGTLTVYDGLATVIKEGEAELLEEGMMFKLKRRIVKGKMDIKPTKFRGSGNHHKFLVIVRDGSIGGTAQ